MSERDRAKDVEQLHDVLRTFINETKQVREQVRKIGDEEKTIAVKKLMLEKCLNFRHGTTLKYEEFLIALENITIDKVSTAPDNQTEES